MFAKRDWLIYDHVVQINATFSVGQQVKNCCPLRTKQILKAIWNRHAEKQRFSNLPSTEIHLLMEKKDSEGNRECCGNASDIL